jgi:hypothetical protein
VVGEKREGEFELLCCVAGLFGRLRETVGEDMGEVVGEGEGERTGGLKNSFPNSTRCFAGT